MEVFSCPQATSSPRIGPLAQHIHRFGSLSLSPPQLAFLNYTYLHILQHSDSPYKFWKNINRLKKKIEITIKR